MKEIRRIAMLITIFCYLAAVIVKSNFWGNILSSVITIMTTIIIYKAFVVKQANVADRLSGLFLTLSIFFWAVADVLWAIFDIVFNINPEEIDVITYSYSLINLFFFLSFLVYAFQMFRKWNILQIALDTVVISYFIIYLIWIAFLDEDIKNILKLRSDWNSTTCIILDVIMIIWIAIWYISVRNGKISLCDRLLSAAVLLFSITDLVYYYQFLYSNYDPNSLLDAVYIGTFLILAIAGLFRLDGKIPDVQPSINNIGRKIKIHFLLLAPILLIIFKGYDIMAILNFVSIILFYSILSSYIQNSIYKDGLLRRELEINSNLEHMVNERTEELTQKNKVLQQLLDQDMVTGLYNRRYLLEYLETEIKSLKKDETIVLLYIDINRFKMITTMFGNYIGDKIIYEMAQRLKPMNQSIDRSILSAYGDDTYIFAATGKYDYQRGHHLSEEAIKYFSDIYQIDEYQIRITANIGISIYPYDASSKEELIKHADISMTQARMKGCNVVKEFDMKLSEAIFRKNTIEILLKKVNFHQEFMIYYQPQLLTDNKKVIGFEALLRWKTPGEEFIAPSEFIPIAEESGCIIPIGDWVMKSAIQQLIEWNRKFDEKIMVSINVSLKQLNSYQFIESLTKEIQRHEIAPEWVDLEITESQQLQDNPEVINMLQEIRNLGVTISIDDFGTGYSSLSYFKELPADRIKLAKELIQYIHIDDFDYQLVKSIILISKVKGIKVIAEGVETLEQWETLKELQCDEVQGYYFGRPAPVIDIENNYSSLMSKI